MLFRTQCAIAALALASASAAGTPTVFAQAQPPTQQSDQDHKAHHPDGNAPGTQAGPTSPNTPPVQSDAMGGKMPGMMGQGGMMCGDMRQMMSMMQDMHAMMKAQPGMMTQRVDAELDKYKGDLKITDVQLPQWNRFADALRRMAKAMEDAHRQLMAPPGDGTLPARLERMEKPLLDHLYSVMAVEEALQPLYASFTAEQKKAADSIKLGGPMGMM
jgi:hypothetical protein